jgi:hypothetical protein
VAIDWLAAHSPSCSTAAIQEIKTLKKKNTQEQNSRRTRLRLQEEEETKTKKEQGKTLKIFF